MLSERRSFTSRFSRRFDILLADNEPLRQGVYQVRHRVFCQELGFAMQSNAGFETNEYDDHSLQLLLRDRMKNTDIACLRVVEPFECGGGLPFEAFGLRHIDRKLFDWNQLNPAQCCELSRLAVLENTRRQFNSGTDVLDSTVVAKELRPFIPISLLHAAFSLIFERDYEWIFMGAEPSLQRFLARYGFHFQKISPLFDYYGQRAVFVLSREQLLADMRKWKPEWLELYRYIEKKVTRGEEGMAMARAS